MKKIVLILLALLFTCESIALSEASHEMRGSELYDKHCSGCHRDASKISMEEDIVEFIRFPNSPMPAFDASKISDKEARLIADYIKLQVYYASKR